MEGEYEIKVLPQIRPSRKAIEYFSFIHRIITNNLHTRIILDLTEYQYIHPIFAVLVASTIYLGDMYKKKVTIRYDSSNDKLISFLKQSGIWSHYMPHSDKFAEINSSNVPIGFNYFKNLEDTLDTVEQILDTAPVKLEQDLRNLLCSRITEIFSNAFEHGNSPIGVFCCGYINDSSDFSFSVYDAGIGICANVNNYLKKDLSYAESLKWAFSQGNSTLNGIVDYPRGAGLNLLESFVKANKGKIYLTSQGGYCTIDEKERNFYNLSEPIMGTLFSMNIKADNEHIYCIKK